MSLLLP